MTTMQAVRIDKREARRRFNAGELIAVSTTGDHDTITGAWHRAGDMFATFADIEKLNAESVRASARIYWYAPAPTYTAPCGTDFDTESDARNHEALCDQCAGATEAH